MPRTLYFQLEQEAHVIRSSLGVGLTQLRRANLHEKGALYTGFFQLAIGFERMAKLGIVLDSLAHNRMAPPGPKLLKALGHDLVSLRQKLEAMALSRPYQPGASFALSALGRRILDFLSHFARGMRYGSLDGMASGTSMPTPFSEWEPILHDIIATKVRRASIQKVAGISSAMREMYEDATVVTSTDLGGRSLDFFSAFSTPPIYDLAAPHVIWEMLVLLAPMRDFVVAAGHAAAQLPQARGPEQVIPCMAEFFEFIWLERSWQMRRKKWPD